MIIVRVVRINLFLEGNFLVCPPRILMYVNLTFVFMVLPPFPIIAAIGTPRTTCRRWRAATASARRRHVSVEHPRALHYVAFFPLEKLEEFSKFLENSSRAEIYMHTSRKRKSRSLYIPHILPSIGGDRIPPAVPRHVRGDALSDGLEEVRSGRGDSGGGGQGRCDDIYKHFSIEFFSFLFDSVASHPFSHMASGRSNQIIKRVYCPIPYAVLKRLGI